MCKEVIDPYGFIYITTNLINGKRYIGQKKFDGGSRWKSYLGSGYSLIKAIKKYGKENFIRNIIDIAYSDDELNEKEKTWIENYDAVKSNDFYNRIEGGDVSGQLKNRNSNPIICLNNRMIFDSIVDAIQWSGHMHLTIKKTFVLNFKKNRSKKLIFRPLTEKCSDCNELFYNDSKKQKKCAKCRGYAYCTDCGDEFKKNSNSHIRCKECAKERKNKQNKLSIQSKRKGEKLDSSNELESRICLKTATKRAKGTSNQNLLSGEVYSKLTNTHENVIIVKYNKKNGITSEYKISTIEQFNDLLGNEKYISENNSQFSNNNALFIIN
jgi:hypothetical protein